MPKSLERVGRNKRIKKMKKAILLFAVVVMALSLSSCGTTTNANFQSSPVLSRNVDLDPIKADVKIDENQKLKGESTTKYFLCFRVSGDNTYADGINYSGSKGFLTGTLKKVASAAAYKALSSGNYDVLINPTYVVKVNKGLFTSKYNVVVEGYGGKYSNFRTEKQKIIIAGTGKEYTVPDK